ncbi:MAG: hypothetical protein KF905_12760 [Flavobacteriales bacterium]|nr:hypothetical protein [Flavobacteriales bacterium]
MALSLATCSGLSAQGCSDAGVCTAGPIGELHVGADSVGHVASTRHFGRLTMGYAVGEQRTTIRMAIAELSFGLSDRLSAGLRVPYQTTKCDLGDHSAIGDPVLTLNYMAWKRDAELRDGRTMRWRGARRVDFLFGVKLPANTANATVNDRPLPMPYQTSLGTTDLLFGVNYRFHRFNTALAFQLPLDQGNENQFNHAAWLLEPAARGYFESAFLERAPDAVLRFQYRLPFGKFAVQPGLLAIQHLGQDTRLEAAPDPAGMPVLPTRVKVEGSEGLTLNLTLDAAYALSDRWTIELAYGSPLIVREERPDGLTRSMVLNTGLRYAF